MFDKLINILNLDDITEENDKKCHYYTKELAVDNIAKMRKEIYNKFCNSFTDIPKMTAKELEELIREYDKVWFDGDLFDYLSKHKMKITFKVKGLEDFTTESMCLHTNCTYVITLPLYKFSKMTKPEKVGGQLCNDHLEALLRVVEHELVHLIIFMFCGSITVSDEHGPLFKHTVKNLFGHTDIYHYIF